MDKSVCGFGFQTKGREEMEIGNNCGVKGAYRCVRTFHGCHKDLKNTSVEETAMGR